MYKELLTAQCVVLLIHVNKWIRKRTARWITYRRRIHKPSWSWVEELEAIHPQFQAWRTKKISENRRLYLAHKFKVLECNTWKVVSPRYPCTSWPKFPLFGNFKIDLSRSEIIFGHLNIKIRRSFILELYFILMNQCLKTNSERDKSILIFSKSGNFAHFAIDVQSTDTCEKAQATLMKTSQSAYNNLLSPGNKRILTAQISSTYGI